MHEKRKKKKKLNVLHLPEVVIFGQMGINKVLIHWNKKK